MATSVNMANHMLPEKASKNYMSDFKIVLLS